MQRVMHILLCCRTQEGYDEWNTILTLNIKQCFTNSSSEEWGLPYNWAGSSNTFYIYISLKTTDHRVGEQEIAPYVWVTWYVAHMGYTSNAYRIL
jgi:hypothetical protein